MNITRFFEVLGILYADKNNVTIKSFEVEKRGRVEEERGN